MSKLIKHKWVKQDGFRVHKCERCGLIRKWSDGWKQIVFINEPLFYLRTPPCKTIFNNDKI